MTLEQIGHHGRVLIVGPPAKYNFHVLVPFTTKK